MTVMNGSANGGAAMRTGINYISRANPYPRVYYVDPPVGEPLSSVQIETREMTVRDVRGREDGYRLAEDGFCFLPNRFDLGDLSDDDAIRAHLYPQAEALTRHMTGIEHVLAFDHGIRRRENGQDSDGKPRSGGVQRNVADFVHNDYIPYSAALRVRWFTGDAAETLLRRRFAIYNFWWPLAGPLHDHPLALCVRGHRPDHFIPIENIFERGPNPIAGLAHDPAHEWIYLSGMMPDELMLFRTWDSFRALEGCIPHGAVREPEERPDAPPRASMELRVIAFHP